MSRVSPEFWNSRNSETLPFGEDEPLTKKFVERNLTAQSLLDTLAVAVTIVDPAGVILFYNDYASRILDRRPEYIGRDIRECHKAAESIRRIDSMLSEFGQGRTEPLLYASTRNGVKFTVSLSPLIVDEKLVGIIQCTMKLE